MTSSRVARNGELASPASAIASALLSSELKLRMEELMPILRCRLLVTMTVTLARGTAREMSCWTGSRSLDVWPNQLHAAPTNAAPPIAGHNGAIVWIERVARSAGILKHLCGN
jgi:hypothetical protein